jgi:hypothetical protein
MQEFITENQQKGRFSLKYQKGRSTNYITVKGKTNTNIVQSEIT